MTIWSPAIPHIHSYIGYIVQPYTADTTATTDTTDTMGTTGTTSVLLKKAQYCYFITFNNFVLFV